MGKIKINKCKLAILISIVAVIGFVGIRTIYSYISVDGVELFLTPLYGDAHLLAYYRLDNNIDSRGNYDLATYATGGTPSFMAGKFGNGLDTGSSWGVNLGKYNNDLCITDSTTPMSVSAWVYFNSLPPNSPTSYDGDFVAVPTCTHYSEYTLGAGYFDGAGNYGSNLSFFFNKARAGVANDRVLYPFDITTGTWYNLVGTWDGAGNEKLYLDGKLVASLTGQTTEEGLAQNEQGLGVNGAWRARNVIQAGVGGRVDDLAIFNRVLTLADIYLLKGETYSKTLVK